MGGFYTPVANDVWTAANFISYVRNQTVNQFASAAARTSAITSPADGMISYLADTKRIDVYDGTAAAWQLVAFVPGFAFAKRTTDAGGIASSTTLVDDSQLFVSVVPNALYVVTSHIIYTADASGDLQIGWSGPAGATFNWTLWGGASTSSTGAASIYIGQNAIGGSDIAGGVGIGSAVIARPGGMLATSGTAGTFKMRWAQGTSFATATTVRNDSFLHLFRVG